MTGNDVDRMLKATGFGDHRDPTWDQILWGDGRLEICGIAVAWSSTLNLLQEAEKLGCNFYVTHEPLYSYTEPQEFAHPAEAAKRDWLTQSELTIYRCHDVWDVMPEVGIRDSWSKFLGFDGQPAEVRRFLAAYDLPAGATLGGVAESILERVREVGQNTVGLIGSADRAARRIAVGTGAITPFREMAAMGADLLVLTDDGIRQWEAAQWARDTGVGVVLVNHATAEEPGMRGLAAWLGERVGTAVHHLAVGCLYDGLC